MLTDLLELTRLITRKLSGKRLNNYSVHYIDMLVDNWKSANGSKLQEQLSKVIMLLHVRQHTVAHVVKTIKRTKFKLLAHPPYSIAQLTSDCHLFGPFKKPLRSHWFTSDLQPQEVVLCIYKQPKAFFFEGKTSLCNVGKCYWKRSRSCRKMKLLKLFYFCLSKVYSCFGDTYYLTLVFKTV